MVCAVRVQWCYWVAFLLVVAINTYGPVFPMRLKGTQSCYRSHYVKKAPKCEIPTAQNAKLTNNWQLLVCESLCLLRIVKTETEIWVKLQNKKK